MSAVDETIIRLFFELHGFFVRKPGPRPGGSRKRADDGEFTLLVQNPSAVQVSGKPGFLVFASELRYLGEAEVTVKRWPETRFSAGMLQSGLRLFRFLEKTALPRTREESAAGDGTGGSDDAGLTKRILVVPGLPTTEPYRSKTETLFRHKGISGLISFRAMLLEVINRLDANSATGGSETLETLRLLKKYNLAGSAQMELF